MKTYKKITAALLAAVSLSVNAIGAFAANNFTASATGELIKGDVNADGEFNVADIVLFQKWLLGVSDDELKNWKAADFHEDGALDAFDLCFMKRELIEKNLSDDSETAEDATETVNENDPYELVTDMSVYSTEELNRLKDSPEPEEAEFAGLMGSLPVPYIEGSKITRLSHQAGISEDTGKPYDIAYVTIELPDNEWVRLEYMLDTKNISIEDVLSDTSCDMNIYEEPVKIRDDITVYAETKKQNGSGSGYIINWYIDYNGMLVRAVYKCNKADVPDILKTLGSITVVSTDDIT